MCTHQYGDGGLDIHLQITLDEPDKITADASAWIDENGGF